MKLDTSTLPFFGSKAPSLETSGKVLIASNVLAIILAVIFQFDFAIVIWSYWIESVIIGIFTFFALIMTSLQARKVMGIKDAFFYPVFFAVHYGGFHTGYLIFMLFLSALGLFYVAPADYIWVILTSAILFLSHGFSFIYNKVWKELMQRKAERKIMPGKVKGVRKELERQMTKPYNRIIPIHLTIMFTGFFAPIALFAGLIGGTLFGSIVKTILLTVFMGLKTVGDLWAHNLKNKIG